MRVAGLALGVFALAAAVAVRARRARRAAAAGERAGAGGANVARVQRLPLSDMPPLQNDRLLRAARGEPVDRVPVWCMRQAGRYLPEFRAVRAQHGFFTCCRTPELAAELTIQPLRRFDLDACVQFSDILVIPQAMGFEVQMRPGVGPVFPRPLASPEELAARTAAGGDLTLAPELEPTVGYVFDAINLTRSRLAGRVPLLGFTGAPWTLMVYMVEGKPTKTAAQAKAWLYRHRAESHALLQAITDCVVPYLVQQVAAGAQALQVFDTTGVAFLTAAHVDEFVVPYLVQIAQRVRAECPGVPLIAFAKDCCHMPGVLEKLAEAYDVIQIDWRVDAADARRRLEGTNTALQGNMDPCALYAAPDDIRAEVRSRIEAFGTTGYIANLGHGMHPDHDPERLKVFIDATHELSSSSS